MAKWCVIVLLLAQNIFADNTDNCDACIRTGSTWCHQQTSQGHCVQVTTDDGCSMEYTEKLPSITTNRDGDLFKPEYAERTLYISSHIPNTLPITYTSSIKRNVTFRFVNQTTKDPKIDINIVNTMDCVDSKCTVELMASPSMDFCSYYEFVDVMVAVDGFKEEAQVRYHVPCSCPCTKQMEVNSTKCSHHGNYTCGICSCENELTGEKCDEKCWRGDGTEPPVECMGDMGECNNNGKCPCNVCKCFEDVEGSQYLEPIDKCESICTQTLECSDCLLNATLGPCDSCQRDLTRMEYNKTIVSEKDQADRKVWVHCKTEFEVEYYTMRIYTKYYVMMNSYGERLGREGATSSKVPLILGILFLIAMVAMIAGIAIWKYMSALPALPTTDSQYANLDAEDCTGENPLYKPPTSSFKNPTYGKW